MLKLLSWIRSVVAGLRRPLTVAFLATLAGAWLLPLQVRADTATTRVAPNFTLSDQNGRPFTLWDHRGSPIVLFFGYTHCADVCPTILANLARARAAMGTKGSEILVVFVTVDPDRDQPAALREYVSVFDPSFVGLTGSNTQLAPVYRAYHVRVEKQAADASGYSVAHTAFVYYIGRDGRVRRSGTWSDPQEVLKENLAEIASSRGT